MRAKHRNPRRRAGPLALVVICAALATFAPATASAQLGVMPIFSLSPPNGSTLTLLPSQGSTRVVFQSLPATSFNMITGITYEVSSQPILGEDGTLSDDFDVDYNYIHTGDTDPSVYVTGIRNWNFAGYAPGTYYFQISAYMFDTFQHVASPVYSFTWNPNATAPAPAPAPAPAAPAAGPDLSLSTGEALSHLRYLIRHKTRHSPKRLRAGCTRVTSSSFSCTPRFHIGRRAYSGHFTVHNYVGDDGTTVYWTASFVGRRSGGAKVFWLI
jgi:hypothetical protein